MTRRLALLIVSSLLISGCQSGPDHPGAFEESVFVLVRHAEKIDESKDSPLTELGHRRAQTLADMLRDAGIGRVYSSDFIRTRDTAEPLATHLGLDINLYDPKNLPALAEKLLQTPGRYLVVGHSDTTPELVRLLGGEPGSDIASGEYDRLYLLIHHPRAGTRTIQLRFEPH